MIRPLELTDDLKIVSKLIYKTDSTLFPFLFGKEHFALKKLEKLVKSESNSFSYKLIHAYFDNNQIKGILIEVDSNQPLKEEIDYMKVFNPFQLILLGLKQLLLFPLLKHPKTGRYIQNVSVDEMYRGQGIGRSLLEDAISRSKKDQVISLNLDVAKNNKGARKLYESLGFQVIGKKRVWGIILATYKMRLKS